MNHDHTLLSILEQKGRLRSLVAVPGVRPWKSLVDFPDAGFPAAGVAS
jgi:hypothetical protein